MPISEMFVGSAGRIFSSACVIIILLMMFIVSLRLYLSRRKKAYLSLVLSLVVIIVQYGLLIGLEIRSETFPAAVDYSAQVLKVIAFIVINMGIYQLYNSSKTRENIIFGSLLLLTLLIVVVRFVALYGKENPPDQLVLLQGIWIELYLFILVFLCFYLINPFIGQNIKYQLMLTVYFVTHLCHMIDQYIVHKPLLSITQNFLPILYYLVIFLFLFERIVELMQATYKSSITDGLTGLNNRRFFFNRVSQYISRHIGVSILFFDIDNFKKLNDTRGHHAGDGVLKHVAEIITEECGNIGVAGRYGGEELVIMVTDPGIKAFELAENIRLRIEAEAAVTVSVGCSKYRKGISASELIKQADNAMYHSKKSGKNKVTVYSDALTAQVK